MSETMSSTGRGVLLQKEGKKELSKKSCGGHGMQLLYKKEGQLSMLLRNNDKSIKKQN